MNILVVGFGAMGCRHAQSLVNAQEGFRVFVVEPNDENFYTGLQKIHHTENDLARFKHIDEINVSIDLAIIATSSTPRFDIFSSLIHKGVKYFLIEKVVFQSLLQFEEAINLVETYGVKAYCNFVNRYFQNYIELKAVVKRNSAHHFSMNVLGGEFGLACNAIHYLDLFEYLTNSHLQVLGSLLQPQTSQPNKRGDQYKELTGSISGKNNNGDHFTLVSDFNHTGGVILSFQSGDSYYYFNEATLKQISFEESSITEKEFAVKPTSVLTSVIVKDILAGKSLLSTIEQTFYNHQQLFKHFNPAFGLPNALGTICPIT